jgi:DNA-binding MarR family transcriptional regulator
MTDGKRATVPIDAEAANGSRPDKPRRAASKQATQTAAGPARKAAAPRARKIPMLPLLGDDALGLEARVSSDDHQALKVWLRLLSCSTDIETEIRKRLRVHFGMTLARFDYLAQLHRYPDGLRMNTLSKYLMVTGGNVTGLTDELAKEGYVARETEAEDRRSFRVSLTPEGRKTFEKIAALHESWVIELFAGMSVTSKNQLYDLLGRLRVQLSELPDAPGAGLASALSPNHAGAPSAVAADSATATDIEETSK